MQVCHATVQVELTDGSSSLALLPAKFRKKLWIRRGNFVIIERTPQAEGSGKGKISGSIEAVLSHDDVNEIRQRGLW